MDLVSSSCSEGPEASKPSHGNVGGRKGGKGKGRGSKTKEARVCPGHGGTPCTFSVTDLGKAAVLKKGAAGCVFCCAATFHAQWEVKGGALVTAQLGKLSPNLQEEALQRFGVWGGMELGRQVRQRLKRWQWRHNPERPRRGPRGPYAGRRQGAGDGDRVDPRADGPRRLLRCLSGPQLPLAASSSEPKEEMQEEHEVADEIDEIED